MRTEHYLPGRVRFRVPSLVGNTQDTAVIDEKLPGIEGVQVVQVNAATGSFRCVLEIDNSPGQLPSGFMVRMVLPEPEPSNLPQQPSVKTKP